MATSTEQLVLSISADTRNIQRQLNKLQSDTVKTTKSIEQSFDRMGSRVKSSMSGLGSFVKGGLAGLATGFSIEGAQRLLDTNTRIKNSLRVTGLEGAELTRVYDQLYQAALRNHTPFESLATLYSKVSLVQKELGVSSDQLIKFTDNIGKALRVGGTSAESASGALLQLSQALGSGVVRAEEFNSILEGAPTILQAAAAGIKEADGSVAKLRQLMLDGQISSKAFFDAIERGAVIFDEKLANSVPTISNAFVDLGNVLIGVAGRWDESTGASEKFAEFISHDLVDAIQVAGNALNWFSNGPLATAWNGLSSFTDLLLQNAADAGAALGTDQVGRYFGVQPYIGPGRIGQRIGGAFGNQPFTVPRGGSGGNVPNPQLPSRYWPPPGMGTFGGPMAGGAPYIAPLDTSRVGTTGVNPITLSDYPTDGKAGKAAKSAADKLAKEKERAAEEFAKSIGKQAEIAVDYAATMLGANEKTNAAQINAFLRAGGVDLDASSQAWCAAFVKASLARLGITGLPQGNAATDFLNFGKGIGLGDVRKGDVIVQSRGNGPGETGGHVGLATGNVDRVGDQIKRIEILSGNASNQVKLDWVDAGSVIARRATEGTAAAAESFEYLTEKTDQFTEAQKRAAEMAQEVNDALSGAMKGFISDLIDGKDATEALKDALGGLADRLIGIALDSLFSGFKVGGTGGTGAGGLLGGAIIPGILHSGGTAGSDGYGHGRSFPASTWANAPRYHNGTLNAGEVPAILQRGEIVLPKGSAVKGGSRMNVMINNYSRAEVKTREAPDGRGFEVLIEERVADRINTHGSPLNKSVKTAASGRLKGR